MNFNIHTNLRIALAWLKSHRMIVLVACVGFVAGYSLLSDGASLQSRLLHQIPQLQKQVSPVRVRPAPRVTTLSPVLRRRLQRLKAAAASSAPASLPRLFSIAFPLMDGMDPVVHPAADFPPFGDAVSPVAVVPNWGAMMSPREWNRTYAQMTDEDFVRVPEYDLAKLLVPFRTLILPRNEEELTRKLYYSTKFFGAYDLDAPEFTAAHPGVDLKLAQGTPVGSVAGGRVHGVRSSASLGTHVIIEHRHPSGEVFYSVYGHLGTVDVVEGEDVGAGTIIGTVGMTGNTSGPHLHLQIDRGSPGEKNHLPYQPSALPSAKEAEQKVIHPIRFMTAY